LLRDDAFLIGRLNQDECDVARRATATASSEAPDEAPNEAADEAADGCAQNVLSGQNRSVHGPKGARPEFANEGLHRWISGPARGLPAWLELRWQQPVAPAQIQLIFDTGMHRVLTMSHADGYVERMEWGVPQPETVRDYTIEGEVDGDWQRLHAVEGNYQRRRVHTLENPPGVTALRVVVSATNGIDHARIFEVRVYES
jgi:hypothetical protein